MPTLTDNIQMPPAKCAVTGATEGEFIDTGCRSPYIDPYIYLYRPWVEEVATELLGMVSAKKVAKLEERLAARDAEIDDLKDYVESMKRVAELSEGLKVAA